MTWFGSIQHNRAVCLETLIVLSLTELPCRVIVSMPPLDCSFGFERHQYKSFETLFRDSVRPVSKWAR